MDYKNWENFMLNQGYPKPFLKNIAVGAVVTLQTSLVKISKSSTPEEILDETKELKFNAQKFGLSKLDTLSDTLSEKLQQEKEFKNVLKEMAVHLKEYKSMVKENCAS